MFQGFKEFISRGSAIDIAVGVVIGAAFTLIVTQLVDQVLNPLIAGAIGEPNFDEVLAFGVGEAVVRPGTVLTAIVNFLLVAAALYLFIVMPMNEMNRRRAQAEEEATEPDEVALLTEIRDALLAGRITTVEPGPTPGGTVEPGPESAPPAR